MTQPRDTADVIGSRGTAATADLGLLTGNVPTADDLSMVGETVNYTGANLNIKRFEGGATDVIAAGVALTTSTIAFYFPVSFFTIPTSHTESGTFTVKTAGGVLIESGLSGFSSSSISSAKFFRLIVAVTGTPLTSNSNYELGLDTGLSFIEVNS